MSETSSFKPPHFADPEAAREAGRKGGARRRETMRLRREDPEAYVRATFEAKTAELSAELLAAALGEGHWKDLEPAKRLSALTKALEYAIGRPTARKDAQEASDEETPGLHIE